MEEPSEEPSEETKVCIPKDVPSERRDSISQHKIMCCSKTQTRESLDYNVKIAFMTIIMLFSMSGIIYNELWGNPCSPTTPILTGILTGIIGLFIPTPRKG